MADELALPNGSNVQQNEKVDEFVRRVIFRGVPGDALMLTLLLCQRYGLDPLMKHVVVIQFKGHAAPYITRDGLLHVAHRSGQLDGMSVSYGSDERGEWAECTIWRKDMSHPFTYRVYRKEYDTRSNVWASHPLAMLAKTAEVFTLRRAFDVAMTAAEEMEKAVYTGEAQIIEAEEYPPTPIQGTTAPKHETANAPAAAPSAAGPLTTVTASQIDWHRPPASNLLPEIRRLTGLSNIELFKILDALTAAGHITREMTPVAPAQREAAARKIADLIAAYLDGDLEGSANIDQAQPESEKITS